MSQLESAMPPTYRTPSASDLVGWVHAPRSDAGMHWLVDDGSWSYANYRTLALTARRIASYLGTAGIRAGDVVSLALSRADEFVAGFFGALYAGATPSPLAPPLSLGAPKGYVEHTAHLLRLASPGILLADHTLHHQLGKALAEAGTPEVPIATAEEAVQHPPAQHPIGSTPVALLQFTSGSSARPRGIEVETDALLANIEAIRRWLNLGSDEPTASWLPAHHDMGLVGCLLTPILNQSPLRLLRPDQFVRDPGRWLACFGRYGAVATATPTFGLAYTLSRFDTIRDVHELDLSGWRIAIVGAEPIDPVVLARFTEKFAPYGFDPAVFRPAYGLAEATLAVTGSDGLRLVRTSREGAAIPETAAEPLTEAFSGVGIGDDTRWAVSCGRPHPGIQVDILDDAGTPVRDGQVGEIAVTGPSVVTREARGQPSSSTRLVGRQLRTGDAGFLLDGQLVVLGRIGDSLKVRGRTVYAEDLEAMVAAGTALPADRTAVLLGTVDGNATAVLVVEAEPEPSAVSDARAILSRETGGACVRLFVGRRGTILRTSSGKVRRREVWRRLTDVGAADRAGGEDADSEDSSETARAAAAAVYPSEAPPSGAPQAGWPGSSFVNGIERLGYPVGRSTQPKEA